jgi:hypothetical protein
MIPKLRAIQVLGDFIHKLLCYNARTTNYFPICPKEKEKENNNNK